MDHSIGELARLGGVTVKTVRYYSDHGLLPSRRTAAGHRRYDADAVARLELIRTLRSLGIDLPTVRAVLERERTLADVLTAHRPRRGRRAADPDTAAPARGAIGGRLSSLDPGGARPHA